jgi:peroxiredoxin
MSIDVGSVAPDFTLKSQHGEDITLSSFRGDTNVLIVFFPFAFSGICTGELGEIRDNADVFEDDGVQVLAVSCDHFFANRAFADRDDYAFPILSDFWPHGDVAKAYGTFNDDAGVPNRGTYLVDREGNVRWMVQKGIGEPRDLAEYRAAVAELS